jgi:hypothetical protein
MTYKPAFTQYSVVGRKADGSLVVRDRQFAYETVEESEAELSGEVEKFRQSLNLTEIVAEGLTVLSTDTGFQFTTFRITYAIVKDDEVEILVVEKEGAAPTAIRPFQQDQIMRFITSEIPASQLWVISIEKV